MLYLRLRWHFHRQPYIVCHLQLSQNNTFQAEISIFSFCQEVGVCLGEKFVFLKNSNGNFFEWFFFFPPPWKGLTNLQNVRIVILKEDEHLSFLLICLKIA